MSRKLDTPPPGPYRNVHIYDNDGQVLGAFYQNGSITNIDLYGMCDIFIIAAEQFTLFRHNKDGSTGSRVIKNEETLLAELYVILTNNGKPNSVRITHECAPRRIVTRDASSKSTPQTKLFHDRVFARDNQCVISGTQHISPADFSLFNAAHIFPYAREQAWVNEYMSRWITDKAPSEEQGENKIHSVQNGLLVRVDVHKLFDIYGVSVNVDDGYRIVCFGPDPINIDGRTLSLRCRDPKNPDRVSDQLLQWHYRQAALAMVKGKGQKPWDDSYDSDIMAEIQEGPDAAERMEVELFTRLGAGEIDYSAAPAEARPP
ncbi:hypothetical protein V496_09896 [Pseudogymnoascus sp. VKM F-4515 (FW-2607)]|nr:hypothetical protein V496_09896 [Pseudogymnoascus sp. VKM F-4515 (FW-2607)]KFY83292.1 hypothetical protein V498_08175 [Pseudogymnoascus sp. VKM F-4517 (FW-2822)]